MKGWNVNVFQTIYRVTRNSHTIYFYLTTRNFYGIEILTTQAIVP